MTENISLLFLCILVMLTYGDTELRVIIRAREVDFGDGEIEASFESDRGTLLYLKAVELEFGTTDYGNPRSLLVSPGGTDLLTISRDGVLVDIQMPSLDTEINGNITVWLFEVGDTRGKKMVFDSDGGAEGLTVDGNYIGLGSGKLYVSYHQNQPTLKFPHGAYSPNPEEVVNVLSQSKICPGNYGRKTILKQSSLNTDGLLLFICGVTNKGSYSKAVEGPDNSTDSEDSEDIDDFDYPEEEEYPTYTVSAWAYNETSGEATSFYVESREWFVPRDMAELPNGDIMILFRGFKLDEAGMNIGYITAEGLKQAINSGGTVKPDFILQLWQSDGFRIQDAQGIAVRQDPNTHRTYVYILSDDEYSENDDLRPEFFLTVFEWYLHPSSPYYVSYAGELHATTALSFAMGIVGWLQL